MKLERIKSIHLPTVLSSYEPKFMNQTCSEPCEITSNKFAMATTRRPLVQFRRIFRSSATSYQSFPQTVADVPQLNAETARALCLLTYLSHVLRGTSRERHAFVMRRQSNMADVRSDIAIYGLYLNKKMHLKCPAPQVSDASYVSDDAIPLSRKASYQLCERLSPERE